MKNLLQKNKRTVLLLSTGILLASISVIRYPAGASSSQAENLLKKAHQADLHVSYKGNAENDTRYNGHQIHSRVQVLHKSPSSHRINYLSTPLNGMVIISDGKTLWRIDPRHKKLYQSDAPHPQDPQKLKALLTNYQIKVLGEEQIAGRKAIILAMTPNHTAKISKKLWVDAKNNIILGSEDYNAAGQCISKSRFSQIQFPTDLPVKAFRKPAPSGYQLVKIGQGNRNLDQLSKELKFKVKVPGYLPAGYRLERVLPEKCGCRCDTRIAHLRYSDGLSGISILECPSCAHMKKHEKQLIKDAKGLSRASHCGAAEIVVVDKNGLSITLVGNISAKELRKIGDSIH